MPSRLNQATGNLLSTFQRAGQVAKDLSAQISQIFQTFRLQGPWDGFQPDIDPNLVKLQSFRTMQNVVAKPSPNGIGEVLTIPHGFDQLDSPRLPLGDDADTTNAIVRLDQMAREDATGDSGTGDFGLTALAATAGDGNPANPGSSQLWKLDPSTGLWEEILHATAAPYLLADIDGRGATIDDQPSMPDSCVFPFGATHNEPVWVYTNNVDDVAVYPSTTGGDTYDKLPGIGAGANKFTSFRAISCEYFNGRVYFLNTYEDPDGAPPAARHSRRLRRTVKFDADITAAQTGAGAVDLDTFRRHGLRIETLGDVMAAYFLDGVAFIHPTGNVANPDEEQAITHERGLLGTHCVATINRSTHFGIFTDGWWLLDQSGRWQEVGITNLDGRQVTKWRETFFQQLDIQNAHRIQVYYEKRTNYIYITFPTSNDTSPGAPSPTNNMLTWIYDINGERVFIENYPVTCFGSFDAQIKAAQTIGSLAPSSIGGLAPATIGSFGAEFGQEIRVHGNASGFVYAHDPSIKKYDNSAIAWSFESALLSPTSARNLTTIDRISLEYLRLSAGSSQATVAAICGSTDGSQVQTVSLTSGTEGDIRRGDAWFRFASPTIGYRVSGSGDFQIRSVELDAWVDPNDEARIG